jgi:hypothetical protein
VCLCVYGCLWVRACACPCVHRSKQADKLVTSYDARIPGMKSKNTRYEELMQDGPDVIALWRIGGGRRDVHGARVGFLRVQVVLSSHGRAK